MAISSHIKPAHNYVPEYQQSSIPWVKTEIGKAAPVLGNVLGVADVITNIDSFKTSFSRVTRWFIIYNHGNNIDKHLRVYFSEESAKNAYSANANDNYFLIDGEIETNRLEVKCKTIYILPDNSGNDVNYSLIAGLTNIRSEDFPDQTTSNGFTGI